MGKMRFGEPVEQKPQLPALEVAPAVVIEKEFVPVEVIKEIQTEKLVEVPVEVIKEVQVEKLVMPDLSPIHKNIEVLQKKYEELFAEQTEMLSHFGDLFLEQKKQTETLKQEQEMAVRALDAAELAQEAALASLNDAMVKNLQFVTSRYDKELEKIRNRANLGYVLLTAAIVIAALL